MRAFHVTLLGLAAAENYTKQGNNSCADSSGPGIQWTMPEAEACSEGDFDNGTSMCAGGGDYPLWKECAMANDCATSDCEEMCTTKDWGAACTGFHFGLAAGSGFYSCQLFEGNISLQSGAGDDSFECFSRDGVTSSLDVNICDTEADYNSSATLNLNNNSFSCEYTVFANFAQSDVDWEACTISVSGTIYGVGVVMAQIPGIETCCGGGKTKCDTGNFCKDETKFEPSNSGTLSGNTVGSCASLLLGFATDLSSFSDCTTEVAATGMTWNAYLAQFDDGADVCCGGGEFKTCEQDEDAFSAATSAQAASALVLAAAVCL